MFITNNVHGTKKSAQTVIFLPYVVGAQLASWSRDNSVSVGTGDMLGNRGIGVGFWIGREDFSLLSIGQIGSEGYSPRVKAAGTERISHTTIQ